MLICTRDSLLHLCPEGDAEGQERLFLSLAICQFVLISTELGGQGKSDEVTGM